MSTVRQEAIRNITCARHHLNRVDFKKTHVKDLYGVNVFNEEVQKARLPKPVYQALQRTIKLGQKLETVDAKGETSTELTQIEDLVTSEVGGSALFAARFRECAARA